MRALLASLAFLTLAVAGCSGDPEPSADGGAGGMGMTGSMSQSTTGSSAMAPTSAEVALVNDQFEPREVTVRVGGSVRWVTEDSARPHNVVSESPGNQFRSPDMDATLPLHEREFTHAFGTAGTVDYLCEYHPGMVGRVLVVE